MAPNPFLLGVFLALGLIVAACGKEDPASSNDAPAPASDMIWADGWSQIEIHANYSKTVLDTAAHFTTDRNRCGLAAYGALKLEVWNDLVTSMNKHVSSSPLADERCIEIPSNMTVGTTFKFDGYADLIGRDGKKTSLLVYRNWTVCSNVRDRALHEKLVADINQLVLIADKEDCDRP